VNPKGSGFISWRTSRASPRNSVPIPSPTVTYIPRWRGEAGCVAGIEGECLKSKYEVKKHNLYTNYIPFNKPWFTHRDERVRTHAGKGSKEYNVNGKCTSVKFQHAAYLTPSSGSMYPGPYFHSFRRCRLWSRMHVKYQPEAGRKMSVST